MHLKMIVEGSNFLLL